MSRFSKIFLAGSALAVLLSVPLALSAHIAANARDLATLDEDWSKAAAAKDVERVASFYAEDATAYPPNAPAANGKAAAKKVWAAYFADPSFAISWKTQHAEVTGDLGYTSGTSETSFNGPDGKPVHEKGKFLCVWRKQKDGSWKAIHDMWNAD
jgi:uncharacterized protein (TIGR02246 family)